MKQELAAVFALMKLLVTKLHVQETELFIEKLLVALKEKFQGHWYPDNPSKGQAYRSCAFLIFHTLDRQARQQKSSLECNHSSFSFWKSPSLLTVVSLAGAFE